MGEPLYVKYLCKLLKPRDRYDIQRVTFLKILWYINERCFSHTGLGLVVLYLLTIQLVLQHLQDQWKGCRSCYSSTRQLLWQYTDSSTKQKDLLDEQCLSIYSVWIIICKGVECLAETCGTWRENV